MLQETYTPPWPDPPDFSQTAGLRRRQFTLANLFLETFWIAAFLGSIRLSAATPIDYLQLALLLNIFTFAVAAGGAFGRMRLGAIVGAGIVASLVQVWLAIEWPFLLANLMNLLGPPV